MLFSLSLYRPDGYGKAGWGTLELGVLAEGQMGLGHANGQVAKALLFVHGYLLLSLLAVCHTRT